MAMGSAETGTGAFGETIHIDTLAEAFNGLNEDALRDNAAEALIRAEEFAVGKNMTEEMKLEREFPALAKMRGDYKDNLQELVRGKKLLPAMARGMSIGFDSVIIALSLCDALRAPLQQLKYEDLTKYIGVGVSITADPQRLSVEIPQLKVGCKPLWKLRGRLGADITSRAMAKARAADPSFVGEVADLSDTYSGPVSDVRFGNHSAIFALSEYLKANPAPAQS